MTHFTVNVPGHHETDQYVFFWNGIFSNWRMSPFTTTFVLGDKEVQLEVHSAESAMMLAKAALFNDTDSFLAMQSIKDPSIIKQMGRQVKGFIEEIWVENREQIVTNLLKDKFTTNVHFAQVLLNTGNKILVEASPYDQIWGIGMGVNECPQILDPDNWKGLNLLGKCLMNVREWLKQQPHAVPVDQIVAVDKLPRELAAAMQTQYPDYKLKFGLYGTRVTPNTTSIKTTVNVKGVAVSYKIRWDIDTIEKDVFVRQCYLMG